MDDQARADITGIKLDIREIKTDLATHMKRTDLLEEQTKPMKDLMISLHGFYQVLKVLALIGAIAEAIRMFK